MTKSKIERIREISAVINSLITAPADNDKNNTSVMFNNLDEQDKDFVVNIICMSLLKSVVLNNKTQDTEDNEIDFDLNNGFSFQQWEELYFENLSFKDENNLLNESGIGNSLNGLYNNFSKKLNENIFLDVNEFFNESYKKFGFKKREVRSFVLSNIQNFIAQNIDYIYPKITWMGQDEAFFLTFPNREPSKLKLLKKMIDLSCSLPGIRNYFITKDDVKDIFNNEIENISVDEMKKQIVFLSKNSNEEDKRLMLLDNVSDLLNKLNPRLSQVISMADVSASKVFLDKMLEVSFNTISDEYINLPMISIALNLMKKINVNQEKLADKLILDEVYFNKLSNFSIIKEVRNNELEVYIDIKQMKVLRNFLVDNKREAKRFNGSLEFILEAEKENRIPHRRFARFLNEKISELVKNGTVTVEEEEQDGNLTGLYFILKNVKAPQSLANVINNYFLRYRYTFSDMANIGNVNTELNSYEKEIIFNEKKEENENLNKKLMLKEVNSEHSNVEKDSIIYKHLSEELKLKHEKRVKLK